MARFLSRGTQWRKAVPLKPTYARTSPKDTCLQSSSGALGTKDPLPWRSGRGKRRSFCAGKSRRPQAAKYPSETGGKRRQGLAPALQIAQTKKVEENGGRAATWGRPYGGSGNGFVFVGDGRHALRSAGSAHAGAGGKPYQQGKSPNPRALWPGRKRTHAYKSPRAGNFPTM